MLAAPARTTFAHSSRVSGCAERLLLGREMLQERDGVFGAWQRGHLVACLFGASSVGEVGKDRSHRVADCFWCSPPRLDHLSDSEGSAALRIDRLIGIDWDGNDR